MISTLNLQGSEGLKGSLTDLAQINILVGKNAAGKSRVLRAIQSSLGTKMDAQDATTPERLTPPLTGIVKVLEMRSTSTPPLTDIEPVLEKLSLSPITTQIRTTERTEEHGTTRRKITEEKEHFLHEGVDIDPQVSVFSGGTRAWARLRSDIEKFLEKPFGTRSPRDLLVLLIEDIEHGLHPGAQRQMLADVEKLIASSPIPVQVFVTTHSPFIVAGLAKLTTPGKVYLIESGCPTDLFFRAGSVEACRGFGEAQAQLMTNYLLGSELSDWFPSSVVICENSLAVLLTDTSSRFNVPLPIYFLHESGDALALEAGAVITDFLSNMEKVFAKPPMRYLLSFDLVVLTDGPLSKGDEKLIQNLQSKGLKVRAKQVGDKSELEAHYPQEICEEALNESGIPAWPSGDLTAHLKCYYKTLGQNGKGLKDSVGTFKEILAKKVARGYARTASIRAGFRTKRAHVITKTRTVMWLEAQTGQSLEPSLPEQERHLSLWLPAERHSQLFKLAENLGSQRQSWQDDFSNMRLKVLKTGLDPASTPRNLVRVPRSNRRRYLQA